MSASLVAFCVHRGVFRARPSFLFYGRFIYSVFSIYFPRRCRPMCVCILVFFRRQYSASPGFLNGTFTPDKMEARFLSVFVHKHIFGGVYGVGLSLLYIYVYDDDDDRLRR